MLLVYGSIAIDSVHTPAGDAPDVMGGSVSYFTYAASFFSPVRIVGAIGEDFPDDFLAVLKNRPGVDLAGLVRKGKTFRWKGRYTGDMNVAETLEVHLNVLGEFDPDLPESYRDSKFIFLANGSPQTQRKVLHQIRQPKLVVADTMNLWIETARDELLDLMRQIDGLVLNDQEALLLTECTSVVAAGKKVLEMGPKFVIIKKGEHGAMFFDSAGCFSLPAYPTSHLVDPTGAGDSFAGGMMGYLSGADKLDRQTFKRAMAYGAVVASINVEDFTLKRFMFSSREEIENRYRLYCDMLDVR